MYIYIYIYIYIFRYIYIKAIKIILAKFGKTFRSHVAETELSQKRTLEVFSSGNRSAPSPAKKPYRSATKRMVEGDLIMVKNRTTETKITCKT